MGWGEWIRVLLQVYFSAVVVVVVDFGWEKEEGKEAKLFLSRRSLGYLRLLRGVGVGGNPRWMKGQGLCPFPISPGTRTGML